MKQQALFLLLSVLAFLAILPPGIAAVMPIPADEDRQSPEARLSEAGTNRAGAEPSGPDGGDPEPGAELTLDLSSLPELDFTNSSASFDLVVAEASLELPFLTLSAGLFDFNWEGAEHLAFANGTSQPWEQLTAIEMRKTFQRPIGERLFLTASVGAGFHFEEEVSDSHSADVFAALIWNRSEDWSFLFGAAYSWHPKIDLELELLPVLGFSYRSNAERGFSASLGIPETGVSYRFSPRSALSLSATAQSFVTRLADDSVVAPAGYVEFLHFGLGLFYQHRFGDRFELEVGPTLGFEGELKLHDRSGNLQSTHDLESAPGFSLAMSMVF